MATSKQAWGSIARIAAANHRQGWQSYLRFDAEKSDSGTALRTTEGMPNRRAWDAIAFCINPKHDSARSALDMERWIVVGGVK